MVSWRWVAALLVAAPAMAAAGADDSTSLEDAERRVYRSVDGTELVLYVFRPSPPAPEGGYPAIVFFGGEGWRTVTPGEFAPHCRYFASRGMVAMTATYRVGKDHGTKAVTAVRDARRAIRWVRTHASELGVNPERVAAGGGSTGGHLAACAALVGELPPAKEDEPDAEGEVVRIGASVVDEEKSARPNALVLFSTPLDLTVDGKDEGGKDVASRLGVAPEKLSPIDRIGENAPPTLLVHGTADEVVPFGQAQRFAKAMTKAGHRCDLVGFRGAGHGLFRYSPDGGRFQRTLRVADHYLGSLGYVEGPPTNRLPAAGP